ncbi:MFS transporter [Actinotalea ferrariae CF5-4]|uniref:MFS transporter n=1 Tax=Actinotalea ferrariae CF5-4 TaxID=948458 RepID=A0A021W140_9CELL|nr:MFS transporter [Actinotalea ferrariae]EYR65042.1 MFS transporter [Actinotalea ferrariae CF5-4]
MLRRYAALPRLTGPWFLVVGALARLPVAMTPLGTMLLVTTSTGSLAQGGLATSASALGTAALAPVQGQLADRLGQRRVLLAATATTTVALVVVTVAAVLGWPLPVLLLACAVAGGSAPQVGPLARVRWISLTQARPAPLATAMSWESMVDEVTFVLGPALVGVVAATRPDATLLLAAAVVAVFGTAFAVHPTALPGHPPRAGGRDPATRVPAVLRLVLAPTVGMVGLGAFFGSSQVAVTGITTALGRPGDAGLLYAVMGIGSAVTALAVVALPAAVSARTRWTVAGAGLTAVMLGAMTVRTGGGTALALLLAGVFMGPAIVTLFSVVGELAPTRAAGTAMTLLISANVVGVAIGAAVGGAVAEALRDAGRPPALTFAVSAVATTLLTAAALLHRRRTPDPAST